MVKGGGTPLVEADAGGSEGSDRLHLPVLVLQPSRLAQQQCCCSGAGGMQGADGAEKGSPARQAVALCPCSWPPGREAFLPSLPCCFSWAWGVP